MHITKLPDAQDPQIINRKKANKGCSICPYCGESRDFMYCMSHGLGMKGIASGGIVTTHYTGFLGTGAIKHSDNYKCHTCGCTWESDLY